VVAEHAPILESSKDMLDPGATAAVTMPGAIANGAIAV